MAQFGSALRSGRRGRWFESSHPDLVKALIDKAFTISIRGFSPCICWSGANGCYALLDFFNAEDDWDLRLGSMENHLYFDFHAYLSKKIDGVYLC